MAASTRDRIVVATNELFRRQGYNGTSLSEISKASGVTIGSIYHCFPDGKEALAEAVVDTTGAVYRELFESFAVDADRPVEAFRAFFDGAAAVLEESDFVDPCPIGTVAREVASTNEVLRRAAERAFRSWVDSAEGFLMAAGLDADTAIDLATTFVAVVEGAFVLCRTLRSTEPMVAAGGVVIGSLEAALAAVSSADTAPHAT